MDTAELRAHLYDLSQVDEHRLATGKEIPSAFYAEMDRQGHGPSPDGVYALSMAEGEFGDAMRVGDDTIYGRLHASPLQDDLFIKKASRFYHEPLAMADFVCMRYVYSGSPIMHTPHAELCLREGDLLLINSGFAFSQYLAHVEDLVFSLIFNQDYLIRNVIERVREGNVVTRFCTNHVLHARQPQSYVLFHGAGNERIRPIVERMLCEYIEPDDLSHGVVEALVTLLVCEMLRCPYEFDQTPTARQDDTVARMLDHVDRHYAEVTLRDLSERFGYSEKYVSRLFKKATGQTLKSYVTDKRMRQAASLLENTQLTVREVAAACGLENMTHFYRQFSAAHGCTPKEYRQGTRRYSCGGHDALDGGQSHPHRPAGPKGRYRQL